MIEHRPWEGPTYSEGVDGQRTAIVGYSHWKMPGETDSENMTIDVLQKVISGEYNNIRFFSDIMHYFGFEEAGKFWNRILFFNFLPAVVGDEADKFAYGENKQVTRGAEQVLELYATHKVQKAFVFTTRGWLNHPATEEEKSGRGQPLGNTKFSWGHFKTDGWITTAIGLRHPQGAPSELMRSAVKLGREVPASSNSLL